MRNRFFERGNVIPLTLGAAALLGFISTLGLLVLPLTNERSADMRIEPGIGVLGTGDTFVIHIVVESPVPVNVFSGELHFNNNVLVVRSIDYNTSIADLWAERPWYSNGEGTLNFVGGTTRSGGFTGTDALITVTFEAVDTGKGVLSLNNARILLHDGLGTDAPLEEPIDAVLTVAEPVLVTSPVGASYTVVSDPPSTDLNGDGKRTIADISIFMLNLAGNNPRYDFNRDGKVDIKDLNILLSAQ